MAVVKNSDLLSIKKICESENDSHFLITAYNILLHIYITGVVHINNSEVLKMLELSAYAYKDNMPKCRHSYYEIIEGSKTDTECFIKKTENNITIIFRGTDSSINWTNNFLFCRKNIPYGNKDTKIRVHSGFLKEYKSVRDKIHTRIPGETCKITVTGHSLGAALAVLCAVDLQYNFKNADIEVYLFGCPRVGNKAFVRSYNKRVFKTLRVTNGNDIVTKLPPKIFGYRHAGINIHTGLLSVPGIISFNEHRPESYYKSLWQTL